MPKILVVGSFVVGMTIKVSRPPVLGETLIGGSFDLGPGGKGTNQAIGATRLGAEVNLLACVGEDMFSGVAYEVYKQENIDTTHVHRIPDVNTAVGFVTLFPGGENTIVGDLGANNHMTPAHVEAAEDLIAECDIVLTQMEVPIETMARAMALGRKHRKLTILNPAPAVPVTPDLMADVDIMTPNETEMRILQGLQPDDPTPTTELAGNLLNLGVKQIVVTMGSSGAMVITSDMQEMVPTAEIEAIDVTGAGDSFNAALAVGLGQGLGLVDAVQEATYAGAYAATHLGVIDGLPTRDELEAFKGSTRV